MSKLIKAAVIIALVLSVSGVFYDASAMRDIADLEKANFVLEAKCLVLARHVAALEKTVAGMQARPYTAVASWYGPGFHGRTAADGSTYDQAAFTLAHKTLPFGTIVIIEYNGLRVPAVVTDRGPYIKGRDFDLSMGLAQRLGIVKKGVVRIRVYELDPDMLENPVSFFPGN